MKLRLFLLVGIVIASAGLVCGQSGRRSTGGSTSSTTTSSTTPSDSGPKTTEKKPAPAPKLQLLVGIDRQDFGTIPYYLYDTVLDNVVRRLGEAEIVFANSGGNMNRGEAVHAAKQEKVRWVVNLEIRSIYADTGKQVKNNQDELFVSYVVMEPETAKIKHSGQSRSQIYQNGRGGVSVPSKNGPVYSEYSIRQVATEVADKILADFDITVREGSPL